MPVARTEWTEWPSLGGDLAGPATAINVDFAHVMVFARWSDNTLRCRELRGDAWGEWVPLGGAIVSRPAAVSYGSGRVMAFAQAADNNLAYWTYADGRWSTVQHLSAAMSSEPAAATQGPGGVLAFAHWYGELGFVGFTDGVPGGFPATIPGSWTILRGGAHLHPTAIDYGLGRVMVLCQTEEGLMWWQIERGDWNDQSGVLESNTTSAPTAVSPQPRQVMAFCRGAGNDVVSWTYRDDAWSPPQSLGGNLVADPAVVSAWGGGVSVFVSTAAGDVQTQSLTNDGWTGWQSLGGPVSGPPTAAVERPGQVTVVWTGPDHALHGGRLTGLAENTQFVVVPDNLVIEPPLPPVPPVPEIPSWLDERERKIAAKYDALGGEAALGPRIEHRIGELWRFNGTGIAYDPGSDAAYEMHGDIYQKWLAMGGMGFMVPCTDEMPLPDGVGRHNHFNNGSASIYWHPAIGAHAIWGDIRARWAQLGWEHSYLGYPTSDEVDFPDGGRATDFQHGGIYWWPDTGPIDLRDVVVHYTGMYCFDETSWDQGSGGDEPYAIFGVSGPTYAGAERSRIYEGIDDGDAMPDLLELYRGRPYGLNIGVVVMENDMSDPEKYQQIVRDAVMAAHEAGVVALGLIPYVGPIVAAIAGPVLGELMPDLADALNHVFDWEDDKIGARTITLSARDMVLLAARTENSWFNGIGYKRETGRISGDGANYAVYLGVVPA